jgi:hypothetical protein
MQRHKGQIDLHSMPSGTFVSTELQKKRLDYLRNNTQYREAIEKAQKITGNIDKLLYYSTGGRGKILDAMIKNISKGESVLKSKAKGVKNEINNRIILAR